MKVERLSVYGMSPTVIVAFSASPSLLTHASGEVDSATASEAAHEPSSAPSPSRCSVSPGPRDAATRKVTLQQKEERQRKQGGGAGEKGCRRQQGQSPRRTATSTGTASETKPATARARNVPLTCTASASRRAQTFSTNEPRKLRRRCGGGRAWGWRPASAASCHRRPHKPRGTAQRHCAVSEARSR